MRRTKRQGFTIIELMLAMSFVSVLLLAIVMTAIQAGRIYNKGLTLQSVNQAGSNVGDTLRRDFLQANAQMISQGAGGAVINPPGVAGGRFCLGGFSYLWNLPTGVKAGDVVVDAHGEPINFVRVTDSGGDLCQPIAEGVYTNALDKDATITHLLKQPSSSSDIGLAIHDLQVIPLTPVESNSEALYRVEYIIGTSELSEINTANQRCRPPDHEDANDDFCAINNFEMIVRTNGQ